MPTANGLKAEIEFKEFERNHIDMATSKINKIRELASKLNRQGEFEGYSWIRVRPFNFDKNKSFKENLFELKIHHYNEGLFLSNKIRELEGLVR